MNIGMMWFDNSDKPLATKIEAAANYYYMKYGRRPNVVFLHPSAMPPDPENYLIRLQPFKSMLPGHLWIGVEEVTPWNAQP